MDILAPVKRVVKTQPKPQPAPVPTLAFVHGEWRAFQNGMLASLLGHTEDQRREAREQWSRPHRWAWDCGYAVMSKLTRRADVQLALAFRFGGMEE
jgi:hypothetical protein